MTANVTVNAVNLVGVPPEQATVDAMAAADQTRCLSAVSSLEQKLVELARLLERGLVSQSDYDAKKAELLARL